MAEIRKSADGSRLSVPSGAAIDVLDGGKIGVINGGTIEIQTGGDLKHNGVSLIDEIAALSGLDSGEVGVLNAVTPGTVTVSKAVVVDANKDIGDFRNLDAVNIDAGYSGTAGTVDIFPASGTSGKVALTAANSAGDYTTTIVNASQAGARTYTIPDAGASCSFVMSVGAQTIADSKTFTSTLKTAGNVGAVAGTGVTGVEYGDGVMHQTVITCTNVAVALADEAGVIAYGGIKVYDFPEGVILVLGAIADLDLTKSSAGVNADWDGDFSLGTVTAANDADLTSTEADILPKTATPQAAAGATTANGANVAVAFLDGTTTAKDVFVNLLVDDADHDVTGTACNLILNGTITLTWAKLGDY